MNDRMTSSTFSFFPNITQYLTLIGTPATMHRCFREILYLYHNFFKCNVSCHEKLSDFKTVPRNCLKLLVRYKLIHHHSLTHNIYLWICWLIEQYARNPVSFNSQTIWISKAQLSFLCLLIEIEMLWTLSEKFVNFISNQPAWLIVTPGWGLLNTIN